MLMLMVMYPPPKAYRASADVLQNADLSQRCYWKTGAVDKVDYILISFIQLNP